MLTTLTSWLRPSSARRPRHKATLLGVIEHLEDRVVPNNSPAQLSAGPLAQTWSAPNIILIDDDWSLVGSIVGYRGDGLTSTGGDVRTVTAPGVAAGDSPPGVVDVIANQSNPDALAAGGVAEFESGTGFPDGTIGLQATSTNQSPFVLINLDTTGVANVLVSYRLRDIESADSSVVPVDLQYRIGSAGPFISIPAAYVGDATTGSSVGVNNVQLPVTANNRALVQLRIITTDQGGADEWVGVDDIIVVGNRPPVLTASGGFADYVEPPGSPTTGNVRIDTGMTLTDPDSNDFAGGTLTVTLGATASAGDFLTINDGGAGTGAIRAQGTNVQYEGVTFGTVAGLNSTTLTITFTAATATQAAIQALTRAIVFNNSSDIPSTANRTASFTVTDGDGGTASASRTIQVTDRNDAPTVGIAGSIPTVEEVSVTISNVTVGDVDVLAGTLRLTATVQNTVGGVAPGTLTFTGGGPTVTGSGTNQLVITGTVLQINNAFTNNQFTFVPTPNYNTDSEAAVIVRFDLTDQGNTGSLPPTGNPTRIPNGYPATDSKDLSITVSGRNDPPVANVIGTVSTLAAPAAALPFTIASTPPGGTLTLADVASVTDSATGAVLNLTGVSLSGSGTSYTLNFPSALPTGSYTVALRASTLRVTTSNVTSPAPTLPVTLATAPPGGTLTLANILNVTGPGGTALNLAGVTVSGAGTNFTLTFPSNLPTGTYTVRVVLPVQPLAYPLSSPTTVMQVAPTGTVTEVDYPKSPDLAGGVLTVQALINGGPSTDTILRVRSEGLAPGQIFKAPSSANITYTPVGGGSSFILGSVTSSGTGNQPLAITFSPSAPVTPDVVQALLRNITFATTTFDTTPRILRFNLTDGDGFSQTVAATTPTTVLYADFDTYLVVIPQPLNNAPSFAVPAALPAVLEDAGAQTAATFATSISPGPAAYEAGQTLTFLVSNSNNALFSSQPAISPTGTLTFTPAANANGTATVTVRLMDNGGTANGGVDTSAPQTFTVTVTAVNDVPSFTAANPPAVAEDAGPQAVNPWVTAASAGPADESPQTLSYEIGAIGNPALFAPGGLPAVSPAGVLTYTPAANANGTSTFEVRVRDTGGTANGGVDASAYQTFVVDVGAVNDDPVLTGVTSPVPYLAGQPGTPVLPTVVLTDDSADFDTGVLTVSYTAGSTGSETLSVQNSGPVSLSGSDVQHNGTTVGTLAGGTAGAALTITFNALATPAVVQDVLRNVVFSTPAGTTDRELSVVLTDGDGGTSTPPAAVTVQVTDQVTAVSLVKTNLAPVVVGPSFTWRLTTDLPVSGFSAGNFQLVGTVAGAVTDPLTVSQPTPTTVEITATLNSLVQGTLGLNLVNETGLSVGILNLPPDFLGGVYDVDRVGPTVVTVTNNDAGGDNTVPVNQPVTYTVTFSEDIAAAGAGTFDLADVSNAGTAPVTFNSVSQTGPRTFTVVVTPTGAGTIQLRVLASATVEDTLGNDNTVTFVDSPGLTVDAVAPTVVSVTNNTASTPLNVAAPGQPVTYTVTFSEDVDAASLAGMFSNTGTAPATVGTPVETVIPGVVTVTLTPSAVGTLVLSVAGVKDVAGNPMTAPFTDTTAVTVNVPPTAVNDSYSLPEDGGTFSGSTVLVNDVDAGPPAQTLTVDTTAVTPPTKGTLVLQSDGTFTYTPNLNATGADSFQYRVRDQFGGSATATVNLTITPVNDPPTFTVVNTPVTVFEDSGTTTGVTVLRNILAGPAGETESINPIVVTASPSNYFSVQPSIQRVTLPSGELTGVLTFTPAPNQFGTATITVTVSDAGPGANSTTQQFTIVITPVNDRPTLLLPAGPGLPANPPVSAEDGGLQTVPGFVSFTPGPNEAGLGQTAAYTATVTGTSGGLTFVVPPAIDANGTLTYQAAPDATGTATVQVSVRDSGGTANGGQDTALFTQSFTIVVRSQNDLPIANPDGGLVPKDAGPTFIDTLSNDSPDPDGSEVLTVVSVTQPANGTASVAPGGRGVLYTPAPGFIGTDTFTYTINDGNGGPATSTVTVVVRPVPAGQPLFDVVATGSGPGGGPIVRVNSLSTNAFTGTFAAYDPNFRGGVNVAVGDVNGDGVPDVVVTPGFGGGPHVKIVDGAKLGLVDEATGAISDAAVLASFFAYSPAFRGGVTVTVADVNGDGRADIVTGTGPGGGAHVKVIDGLALTRFGSLADGQVNPNAVIASFFAYDPNFRGGVNVAAGDVNGDGRADIITASGAGGGSHVKVFDGLGGQPLLRSFFAYGAGFRGGVNIAAGDVNGDGLADIITGAGIGGGPHVKVFDSAGGQLASFFGLTGSAAGADVAYRVTKDGTPLVVVGGQSGGSQVRTYAAPNFDLFSEFNAYEPTFLGGVEVG